MRDTLRPGISVLATERPVFRTGIWGAVLDPSTGSRSGKALVPPGRPSGERGSILPVRPLGGCSESRARSYAAGPGFGGREPSRFLGTKRWKSQKLTQLSPEQPSGWKTSEGVAGHSAHITRSDCAAISQRAAPGSVSPQAPGSTSDSPPPSSTQQLCWQLPHQSA